MNTKSQISECLRLPSFLILIPTLMFGCGELGSQGSRKQNVGAAQSGPQQSGPQNSAANQENTLATEPWLGLLGDSGISGAATSPNLKLTWESLGKMALDTLANIGEKKSPTADINQIPNAASFGLKDQAEPLRRVFYSTKERDEAERNSQRPQLDLRAKSSSQIDIPEYSYGYLAGRALGLPASRIVMVAQDGQRVGSIYMQMQRFLDVSPTLPSHILVSFSANDICGTELQGTKEAFVADFRKILEREFALIMRNMKPHPKLGTKFIIMSPLDVPQVLSNESLLQQKITFEGAGEKSCQEVRNQTAAQDQLGRAMQDTMMGMCKAIIAINPKDTANIDKIKAFQEAQVGAWKDVVAHLNQKVDRSQGWSFELNDSTRRTEYQAGDLANDCFHPGPKAHSKIATELVKSLGKL